MSDDTKAQDKATPASTATQPQKKDDLTEVCNTCDCIKIDLKKPFVIATGKDKQAQDRTSGVSFTPSDGEDTPMVFGDDATSGGTHTGGADETALKGQMNGLLGIFAVTDGDGNAGRMYSAFQSPRGSLAEYTDPKLDTEVSKDGNFKSFAELTLNSPINVPHSAKTRIHQKLKAAGWDINQIPPKAITDLGPPAFNSAGNHLDGMFTMVDGVQYVFVHVTFYHYDSCLRKYTIELEFHLYDVFGLDPEDVKRFGTGGTDVPWYSPGAAPTGISAWYSLQHQHGYKPMVTKMVVKKRWTVPAE